MHGIHGSTLDIPLRQVSGHVVQQVKQHSEHIVDRYDMYTVIHIL